MKPSDLSAAIRVSYAMKRPMMIWGPAGVGKSAIMRETTTSLGIDLIDIRAILFDTVDLRGIPYVSDGVAQQATPSFLPTEGEGILFIDELVNAFPAVQAAFYQLTLDRQLGDYHLPDGWAVMAAGNRQTDKGNTFAMPAPLANRFIHAEIEPSLTDFVSWSLSANIDEAVVGFVRTRPDLLHHFDPQQRAFPTPRSWQTASELIQQDVPPKLRSELLQGTIGEGPAAEFEGYLRIRAELPEPEDIIAAPTTTKVPTSAAALYSIATSLAYRAKPDNFNNILTYGKRMPGEYQVIIVKDSVAKNPEIARSPSFLDWAAENASEIL